MEIDAVATCNSCTLHQRKNPKMATVYDVSALQEPASNWPLNYSQPKVSNGNGNLTKDHHPRTDSSIITSLLAVSETADSDFVRQQVRIRPSGDQLGPWLFHKKWLPRKRPNQSRRGKRCRNSISSPTRFMSLNEKAQIRFTNNGNTAPTFSSGGLYQGAGSQPPTGDIVGDESRAIGISSTRPPSQDSVYHNKKRGSQDTSAGTVDTKDASQVYPKHSLPTLITLKPADSSNRYDTVFSLGKSDLSSKEIITSMGQTSNRLPSSYKRQTKSPIESKVQIPHIDSSTGNDAGYQNCNARTSERMPIGNGRSNFAESFRRRQPAPPMCEHNDISLHMRHYRMNHTVRFTGRFSLANDTPEKKEIKAVQWNDVFPHRPLSSAVSSSTAVPVFRFSVADFQREPSMMETESIRDLTESMPVTGKDVERVSARRASSRLGKETLQFGTETAVITSMASKRNSTTKDTKVSLSPTVTPVIRNQRLALTPNTIDEIDNWTTRDNQKMPNSANLLSELEKSRRHDESNISEEGKDFKRHKDINHNGCSDAKPRDNLSQVQAEDNFKKGKKCPEENSVTAEGGGTGNTRIDSKLSKTKAYIQSSYSVYNDTIQKVPLPHNSQGIDYREYLKQKKWRRTSFEWENTNEAIGCDSSIFLEPDYPTTTTSRFKSPNKFSCILKDIMNLSRSKTLYRNFESKRDESSQRKQKDDKRPVQSAHIGNSATLSYRESPSKIKPLLSIDAKQLRDSVERKIHEGVQILPRPFRSRSVDFSGGFIRFLVKENRDQKISPWPCEKSKNPRVDGHARTIFLEGETRSKDMKSFSDKMSGKNLRTAAAYDLNADCDISLTESITTGNESQSYDQRYTSTEFVMNTKKVWRPSASRWNKKLPINPDSRPTSSAFHCKPTSSTPSAFVIATPPSSMGFDDHGVVLPLDDFVRMAMKSREGSFSALSQTVNSGSKVGIAPKTKIGASSARKSSDDGLVRVVSFATPVNQFIFAKRITGYPSTSALVSSDHSPEESTAEDAGRSVFQRKMEGSFRLSLKSAGQRKKYVDEDNLNRIDHKRINIGTERNEDRIVSSTSLNLEEEDHKDQRSPLVIGPADVQENQSTHRKIKVDMCDLLKQVEQIDVVSKDDDNPRIESNLDNLSLKDKRKTASAMRKNVIRLAEMKGTNNTTNERKGESDVTDLSTGRDRLLHASSCTDEKKDLRDCSVDSLASKFSQLRQRRKKILRRNNITKQVRLVHKNFPVDTFGETQTSDSLKAKSVDALVAEGCTPWKDKTVTEETLGRPKTVRFACDDTDVSDSVVL